MSVPSVAVVGVGHMGALHAEKLALLAGQGVARFSGVYDADSGRAREVAERLATRAFGSLEEVVRSCDAACVAVPTIHHAEVALQLLAGGLDVLIEKPIAVSREAGNRLVDVAARGRRILQVGHIERFSRAFEAIQPILRRPRKTTQLRIEPSGPRQRSQRLNMTL